MVNEAEALIAIAGERAKERQGKRTDLVNFVELVPQSSSNGKARINSPFASKVELVPPLSNDNGKARDEVGALQGTTSKLGANTNTSSGSTTQNFLHKVEGQT